MGPHATMLPPNVVMIDPYMVGTGITYAHPCAAFFHCAIKVAAVIVYLICGLFSASYVINFVITIGLLAIDFWIVKNVSGRLMVGLRWWNEVNEQGASAWKFDSLDQQDRLPLHPNLRVVSHIQALERINKNDSWLFWWSLYLNTIVWTTLAVVTFIKLNFDYLLITIIALSLTSANTAGYTKCHKDAAKRAPVRSGGLAARLFQAALGWGR